MPEEMNLDLVTTYVVSDKGVVRGTDAELKDALAKGYRVLDVIASPIAVGGQSNLPAQMTVTVVLSLVKSPIAFPYKWDGRTS
jgi:CO dehydrogenase/acetyl-CoA synthase delta subunit